jgi:hypothetical protein
MSSKDNLVLEAKPQLVIGEVGVRVAAWEATLADSNGENEVAFELDRLLVRAAGALVLRARVLVDAPGRMRRVRTED